jgi:DNA-binding GntR family transcriptional regulator
VHHLNKLIQEVTIKNTRPGKSSERIYNQLKKEILLNQLNAGNSLKQDKIANQFQVSKIPVREALKRLEADGLVEFKARRGAFVIELTQERILENLEIRIALETRAIKLAIPNMTERDLADAGNILMNYQNTDKVEKWSELNQKFHHCLYAPCGLPYLLDLIKKLKERTNCFMRLKISQVSGLERPHREHLAILAACKSKDAVRGSELIEEHIEFTKKEVTAYFRRMRVNQI